MQELLDKCKITQNQLAKRIGKSQQLVSKWCCGQCEPQISDIIQLSAVLHVSISELLRYFNQKE